MVEEVVLATFTGNQALFELYREIIKQHKTLSLKHERKLIALAQKGASWAQEKLLLHLIGFFVFRIRTALYPAVFRRYGEDLIQECLLLAAEKIRTYNLTYRNKAGELQPVHLSTYMWKYVTGLMYSYGRNKSEICFSDLSNSTMQRI